LEAAVVGGEIELAIKQHPIVKSVRFRAHNDKFRQKPSNSDQITKFLGDKEIESNECTNERQSISKSF
jgi:hypothetical protein